MKKLIFIGLSALLAFALVTCDNVQDENIIIGSTNVEYSDDGRNITIYLDGTTVPVTKAMRSLTADLAKKAHDYYEVVFYHNDGTNPPQVTRAAWEIGEAAAVTNVVRTETGIDYALTGATTLAVNTGYAVLFAGRKADKTLLGVGKLTQASPQGATATSVTTATTKITFTVASLEAGAPAYDGTEFPAAPNGTYRGSSFLTGDPIGNDITTDLAHNSYTTVANGTTVTAGKTVMITRPALVAGMSYRFPAFGLKNKVEDLEYTPPFVGVNTSDKFLTPASYRIGSNDLTASGLISDDQFDTIYRPAIRVFGQIDAATAAFAENKLPRFPLAGNRYYEFRAPWAIKTTTEMHPLGYNAVAGAGAVLPNPIYFDIETHAENDGFISFTFTVPVYALSNLEPTGVEKPVTWFIRPGFGTYYYDLDDGAGGAGGSLLIAVGDVNYDSIEIIVRQY